MVASRFHAARPIRRPNWTIRYLWAMYLLFCVALLNLPASLQPGVNDAFSVRYRLLNYLTYLPVILLLVRSLRTAEGMRKVGSPSAARPIAKAWLAILAMMVFVGLFEAVSPSEFIRTIALEALPLVAVTLFLLGRDALVSPRALALLVSLQAMIGAGIAVSTLARHPVLDWRGEVNVAHEITFGLVAPATLAVLLLPILSPWQRVASLVGYAASISLGFAYQGRLAALIQVVALPVAWLFVQWRRGGFMVSVRRSAGPVLLVAILVIGAATQIPAVREQLERGLEGTLERLGSTGTVIDFGDSLEAPEPRWEEAAEFVRVASLKTWLVGEGFGGTWRSEYMASDFDGSRWPMVHFGPLHLVLKGGLPLLVIFHLLYSVILIQLWRGSRHSAVAGAVLMYGVFAYLAFLSHGPFVHRYSTYFTWVVLGVAFADSAGEHQGIARQRRQNAWGPRSGRR
jgi:hypothetical protein